MAQDFCNKYKPWLIKLADQRLLLIKYNKCGGQTDKKKYNAEVLKQKLQGIFSDHSLASFIIENTEKIDSMLSHSKIRKFVKDNDMLKNAIEQAKLIHYTERVIK